MNRSELTLAALAPARGAIHTPVQVQKLLFLIDRNLADQTGGPHFNFAPYSYGPFDKTVYEELRHLADEGLVELCPEVKWTSYRLTSLGQERGDEITSRLSPKAQAFLDESSRFVRRLSFTELVSAIYKAYPEMKVNSVFQG